MRALAIAACACFASACGPATAGNDAGIDLGGFDDDAGFGDGGGGASGPTGCGACSVACTEFARGQDAPGFFLLAADANGVAWSSGLGPVDFRAQPLGGPTPLELASEPTVDAAAADDTTVYWLRPNASNADDLMSVPRAGGAAPRRLAGTQVRDFSGILFADDAALYFLDGPPPRSIERIAKSGGAAHPIASGFGVLAALSDGGQVFYVDYANGSARLLQVSNMGGASTPIATIGYARVLRTDGTLLYFSDGNLQSATKTIGAQPRLVAADVRGPFVLDGGRVYWIESACDPAAATCGESGAVRWVSSAGGGVPRTICTGHMLPLNLVASSGVVYIGDRVTGSILRLVP
jgi:hypothetical protein